jgi:restriction system protein
MEQARDWYRVLLKSTGLAFVFLLAGSWLVGTGTGFLEAVGSVVELAFAASIVTVAVSLYLDIRYIRRHSAWNPTAWMYLFGILVFYLTIPLYFYRRRKFGEI